MVNGGHPLSPWRLAPRRYLAFLAVLAIGAPASRAVGLASSAADALVLGFDLAAALFLASLAALVRVNDPAMMRRYARATDANRFMVLAITTALTVVVMAAISAELPRASAGGAIAVARLIVTLLLTWGFANAVYALHYAHLYYLPDAGGSSRGGLEFPATPEPDYLDFAYFAFTLGMTFQTSDVTITSRTIRRIATLHSFAAFVFNIGVIAFTINALGGNALGGNVLGPGK